MTDFNTPMPELDAKIISNLLGGLVLVGIGLTRILQVPQARDVCSRILSHPEVKKAGLTIVQSLADSLGQNIQRMASSLTA